MIASHSQAGHTPSGGGRLPPLHAFADEPELLLRRDGSRVVGVPVQLDEISRVFTPLADVPFATVAWCGGSLSEAVAGWGGGPEGCPATPRAPSLG